MTDDDALGLGSITRRHIILSAPAALGLAMSPSALAASPAERRATYQVTLASTRPIQLAVVADLPMDGDRLSFSDTYPAELPEMAAKGWPALIRDLTVTDPSGRALPFVANGKAGWRLSTPVEGRVLLRYLVDFSIFEQAGWSSPLESAVADPRHAVASCRAMFIVSAAMEGADVRFRTPPGWHAVAPWPALSFPRQIFRAASTADLTENMLAFTSLPPPLISTAGFTITISAMGHWAPLGALLDETMKKIVSLQAGMMGSRQGETYSVILVPTIDTGGEAYRQSFAYAFADPTADNRAAWANTLAHELFHYWNASRLQGQDYASSQWFQEGFTEYVANLTTLAGKIATPADFLARISNHVANYGRLATSLENIGTHKGPPLYSAGALVAFSFDAMIRHASNGQRTIGTFFRNLWRITDGGARKYAWPEIEAALRMTAPGDWAGYHARHIRGRDKLPLDDAFALAGLQLRDSAVTIDPAAGAKARAVWRSLNSTL